MAVARGSPAGAMLRFDARKQRIHPLDQEFLALRFRADFKQRLLFVKFDRQASGKLVGEGPEWLLARGHPKLAINQRVTLLKQPEKSGFFAPVNGFVKRRRRLRQIFDDRLVVFAFLQELQSAEHGAALGQNVHSAVGIVLDLLRYRRSTSEGGNASLADENDPELIIFAEAVADHHLVALLENVQGEVGAREKHCVEGEKRNTIGSHNVQQLLVKLYQD